MRKAVHLGAKLGSLDSARDSVAETLEVELTTKRVERLTERIGRERVAERELSIAHWEALPLVEKLAALQGIKAPAVAGRTREAGGPVYIRWITWVWQGEVTRVIAELAARAVELGPLTPDAADTDPRQIAADTLTYLTNQQSRMNYPAYRLMGLPITSSHIESTVKQISRRVKGSEKFWTAGGGEALLQLGADQLCETAPLDSFWLRRTRQATGTRNYKRSTQISA